MKSELIDSPFDRAAEHYDETFDDAPIARRLRSLVWQSLAKHFPAGSRVLELNCGTGTDAIVLGKHGVSVTAIDSSARMIERARAKIRANCLEDFVAVHRLSFDDLHELAGSPYDGVVSNFGGLNCASNLPQVVEDVAAQLRPGGVFIACLLNRVCAWEIGSFLLRGRVSQAFRRFASDGAVAVIDGAPIRVWYYSPTRFARMLAPYFRIESVYGLSVCSPSPNARDFVQRHPRATKRLLTIDDRIRSLPLFRSLGDHFVVEARRTAAM